MIGAILGDMIGSPYEFDRGNKSEDFPLFSRYSTYTDDSVMTLAAKNTEMYIDGFKASLVKDTSKNGLWTVSFTLKEF